MKNLVYAIFLVFLTFPTTPLCGDDSRAALSELSKKVRRFTLSNGLRVILYNRGVAPVFSAVVAVRVGGSDELLGETGISHMLEHMAFKGTKQIGTKDYSKEKPLLDELEKLALIEREGGTLTPSQQARKEEIYAALKDLWVLGDLSVQYERRGANAMNATTDKEFTKYFVELPRSAFEFWCWMESERIMNSVMRQFYQERDVVMEERRMRFEDDPGGKLYEMLLGVIYLKHPYRNPVIGYDFDLKNLTATMVANFHREYYVPGNIVVSLVGDVDPESDLAMVEKYFSRLPGGQVPARPTTIEPAQEGERRIILNTKASPQIYIAYRKPNYPHPDDPPISVMAEIIAGSRVSPLYENMVKTRKLVSEVGYDEAPGLAYPNLLMFYATPSNPHTNSEALQAFDAVIEKLKREGIKPELLEISKKAVAMEYLGHIKSSMSLAQDFAVSELLFGNWKASLDWYDEAMKVNVYDVQRVMQKYLVANNRTIGTIEYDGERTKARANFKGIVR